MLPSLEFITTYPFVYDYTDDKKRMDLHRDNLLRYHETKGKDVDWFGHKANIVDSTYTSVLIKNEDIKLWMLYCVKDCTLDCTSMFNVLPDLSALLLNEALTNYNIKLYITKQNLPQIYSACKKIGYKFNWKHSRQIVSDTYRETYFDPNPYITLKSNFNYMVNDLFSNARNAANININKHL